MIKSFEQNGATWTLDMRHVYTRHKMWLDDFANIPHFFSVAFVNEGEFSKVKRRLIPAAASGVRCTGHSRAGSEIRVYFSADTKEAALRWEAESFNPLFREQAVDFYKENKYLPYNFAAAFCDFKPGEAIELHGRIPCWAADLDKVNPLKEPQTWRVASTNGTHITLARNGKEYQVDTSSFFDEGKFVANYIHGTGETPKHINCAKYVYVDPSLVKTNTLDDKIRAASSRTVSHRETTDGKEPYTPVR